MSYIDVWLVGDSSFNFKNVRLILHSLCYENRVKNMLKFLSKK